MEQRKGRRLVLFPLPLQGHINPMIQLANILHSKGFSITIIHTTFNSPDSSKYPHFNFHFIQENLTETEASTTDVLALLSLLNIKCVGPFQDCLSRLLSDVSDEPVSCLISDAIFHFTQSVSNSLKLPRLVLRTSGASSFLIFSTFPFLREKGYLPIQGKDMIFLINWLAQCVFVCLFIYFCIRISNRRASGRVSAIEGEGSSSGQNMPPRTTLSISGQHG